jgi:hypothetical protein
VSSKRGTIASAPRPATDVTSLQKPRQILIQGLTADGRQFRPSDWAERLAGAMSSIRPGGGHRSIGSFIGYSPYCVPTTLDGVKCVVVAEALRAAEPMAWDFVMNFARDNGLKVVDLSVEPVQPDTPVPPVPAPPSPKSDG